MSGFLKMEMESRIEELARSVGELKSRVKSLEDQVKETRTPSQRTDVVGGRKEPWEVVEIGKVMKKWYAMAKEPIIVSASRGEEVGWINTSTIKGLTKLPMDKVMFLLSPFSNEQRLKLLLQLSEYPKSSTDLTNATGLQGGQLYHHLDELIGASYVEKVYKGKYRLTGIGEWAFHNILHTALHLIKIMEQKEQETKIRRGEESIGETHET